MSEKLKQDHFKVTPKKEDPENPTYLTGRGAPVSYTHLTLPTSDLV